MIRIGIECESIEDGETWGVGRIVSKLLQEISRRPELQKEFKFFLYFKSRIPAYSWLSNPIFEKRIVRPPAVPPSFSFYYYVYLPILLWFNRPDAVFFPNYMLPIIHPPFVPSLVMLTDDIYYEMRSPAQKFQYRLAYRVFSGWAVRFASRIMAISETSKRELVRLFGIKPGRITVNPLGVDTSNPQHPTHNQPQEGRQLSVVGGEYLLYVGQAFPRRHLKETMLAFEMIAGRFAGLHLIAIGADRYNPPVIKRLKDDINARLGKERIIQKDYVPEHELASLYSGAKALVYVSSREAFGLPPLEALARGAVPVVAEEDVTREIFGGNAVYVGDPESPDSIASAMSLALTDNSLRFRILASANTVLKKYTWPSHTDRFLDIARQAASK